MDAGRNIETLDDVAEVRRWLSDHVREGNALARRCLRVLDRAASGTEIATARAIVAVIFRTASQADTLLWQWYRDAGYPYGETEEGLARWHREQQEREREQRSRLN